MENQMWFVGVINERRKKVRSEERRVHNKMRERGL
jgi:hypothetical protein